MFDGVLWLFLCVLSDFGAFVVLVAFVVFK